MLFMMTALFTGLQAQDVIFKKNGDEIQARVLKVTESEIEYAKWSNPERSDVRALARQRIHGEIRKRGKGCFHGSVRAAAFAAVPGRGRNVLR